MNVLLISIGSILLASGILVDMRRPYNEERPLYHPEPLGTVIFLGFILLIIGLFS